MTDRVSTSGDHRAASEGSSARWRMTDASADGVRCITREGGDVELTIPSGARTLDLTVEGALGFALFDAGVLQTSPRDRDERIIRHRLERFYAIRRGHGCVALDLRDARATAVGISHPDDDSVRLRITFDADADTRVVRVLVDRFAVPGFARGSVAFSEPLDEQTHLTALWANQVGTLGTVDVPGSVYPTLKLPEREYWSLNTFFDPDSWSVLNCLSFSGDGYLVAEARRVIDRVLRHITADGRVPHHFDAGDPVYVAISGAAQPGPNIFFCLAVLDHIAATGDHDYLRSLWATSLVPCVEALLETFDPAYGLLRSGGPLWIDVFRGEGFTLDTNAITVLLLARMSAAATHLGDEATAARWRAISTRIAEAIDGFWRDDHYATELPGTGDDLDMVDSDDVLVVLAGITDDARAGIIFDRLQRTGMHPGGRGTWVSGRYYGPELCYQGNIGDSSCAFARIWWAEMRARRDRGDRDGFLGMFEAVRGDLIEHTWMGERYDSAGEMTRADGYHEYPGVVDILLREGIYGMVIDVANIDIRPMRSRDLRYRVGHVGIERIAGDWRVIVPGTGERSYHFHDLVPGDRYRWNGTVCTVPPGGGLTLAGRAGTEQSLTRVHAD